MAVCRKCGSELREGAKFCTKCGAAVASESMLKCPVCGASVSEGAKFCNACGASLAREEAAGPAVSVRSDYLQWNILPGQIAVRIDENDLDEDQKAKGISIQPGVKAIVIVEGKVVGELEPGSYRFGELVRESSGGTVISRLRSFISSIFSGRKNEIDGSRFISVILLRGTDFPLVCSFEDVKTKDVPVSVSLHFICRINDILSFHRNLLLDRKSVTFSSFSSFISSDISEAVRKCFSTLSSADLKSPGKAAAALLPLLEERFAAAYPYIDAARIVSVSAGNEDMENLSALESELFVSEAELEHLSRRNDFIVRLNSEDYRQQLRQAESEADFLSLMEKIDEKKELTEEDRRRFAELLESQRKLRQARTADEEAAVLHELRKNGILREDEVRSLEHMLAHKEELQNVTDEQIIARATIENSMELDSIQLRWEMEIGNKRFYNELEKREAAERHEEERRRRLQELDRSESLTQLEMLEKAQAIRMQREEALHRQKIEEERLRRESELEKNRIYVGMTPEQIMAANPDISPAAAAALAERYKSNAAEDKLKLALDQKDEMRSFMGQEMEALRDIVRSNGDLRNTAYSQKDDEIERVRRDAEANQERYTRVMETTVQAVAGQKSGTVRCPSCGADNDRGSAFCSLCGKVLPRD